MSQNGLIRGLRTTPAPWIRQCHGQLLVASANFIPTGSVVEELVDQRIEDLPRDDAPISLSPFC